MHGVDRESHRGCLGVVIAGLTRARAAGMQCFETTTGYRASPNLKLFTMGDPPHVSRGQAISFTIASVMEAYHTPLPGPFGGNGGRAEPFGHRAAR